MSIAKKEKLLQKMAFFMSLVEEENFQVRHVDLCSQFYTFLPNHIITGHMFIIGNCDYFANVDRLSKDSNHSIQEYIACRNDAAKALFLKYHYIHYGEDYKFLPMGSVDGIFKFNSGVDQFLYLADFFDDKNGGEDCLEHISLESYCDAFATKEKIIHSNDAVNCSNKSKKIIKSLNV